MSRIVRKGIVRQLSTLVLAALTCAALGQENSAQAEQDAQADTGALEVQVQPPEGIVTLSGPDGSFFMSTQPGEQTFESLEPGQYVVDATAEGHQPVRREVEVKAGESTSVTIQLESAGGEEQQADQEQEQQGDTERGGQQAQERGQDQQAQQQSEQPAGEQQAEQQVQGGQQGQQQANGQDVYQQQCAQCHGQNGRGGIGPALAGDQNLQDAQWVVDQILHGGGGMPAFADQLSNEQIAAVATHERTSWGNSFGEVTEDQVAQVRGGQAGGEQGQQEGQEQEGQEQQQPKQPSSSGPSQAELDRAAESTDSWLMYNKGYDGQRYSSLDQINADNAGDLRPECAFQTGESGVAFQASPVVYGGALYVTTPHSTYAIDPTTCDQVWKHTYSPTGPEPFPTNRGVAIHDGRLFRGTTDAHFLALDAKTGDVLWDIQPVDSSQGYFLSSAPIVWNDTVITGTAGADWGATAKVFAFDVATGEQVWSFDEIVSETFGSAEAASTGGGSNWTSYTLDADTGLLYVPVGNPAPDFACEYRPGDNLYTNSVIVLDANSGDLVRWYQQIPQDCLDRDTAAPPILFDGEEGDRYMAVASKNGIMYVYNDEMAADGEADQQQGQQGQQDEQDQQEQQEQQERQARHGPRGTSELSGLPPQQNQPQQSNGNTLVYAVEATSRYNVDVRPTTEGVHICPGVNGGTEWYGPTFDPENQRLYVPAVDWCSTFTLGEVRYTPGEFFLGGSLEFDDVEEGQGWLTAFDSRDGTMQWAYQSDRPVVAAVTPTAGGVVFGGELTGDFLALDAESGDVLYRFNTGGPIGGGISTYQIDDRQYVAVASGNSSRTWSPNAGASATVFVFALPQEE